MSLKQPKCRGQPIKFEEGDKKTVTDCLKEFAPDVQDLGDKEKLEKAITKDKMAVSDHTPMYFNVKNGQKIYFLKFFM